MRLRLSTLAGAMMVLAGCASAPAPSVPTALQPPPGETLLTTVAARGVQIYECRPGKDAGAGPTWVFVAPDAELFDASGKTVGQHGAGPYWQASDGSRIVGTVKARADAPATDAIPWLLLTTKAVGQGGAFSAVTSVQRVNTVGGLMPATTCTTATLGTTLRVPYTADYRLFASR